jgi:hypothetical protein
VSTPTGRDRHLSIRRMRMTAVMVATKAFGVCIENYE